MRKALSEYGSISRKCMNKTNGYMQNYATMKAHALKVREADCITTYIHVTVGEVVVGRGTLRSLVRLCPQYFP